MTDFDEKEKEYLLSVAKYIQPHRDKVTNFDFLDGWGLKVVGSWRYGLMTGLSDLDLVLQMKFSHSKVVKDEEGKLKYISDADRA